MGNRTVRVRIEGRVQGVFYRAWTTEQARRLDLDGWVRNRSDGSVEALFSGPSENIEAVLALCRKGPPTARVTRIDVFPAAAPAESGFRQVATD